jgi:hypothetical protein
MCTLWALILPPWKRPEGVSDLRRWSFLLACVMTISGSMMWAFGGLAYMTGVSDDAVAVFYERSQQERELTFEEKLAFNWSGALNFVGFLFTPTAWVALYLILEGIVRWFGFWVSDEVPGSLPAYLIVPLVDRIRRKRSWRRREQAFGDEVVDQVRWNPEKNEGWILEVISAHDKPWRQVETIRLGEDLYELVEACELTTGGHLRIRYRLAPWPTGKVVRSIVYYDAPVGTRPARTKET